MQSRRQRLVGLLAIGVIMGLGACESETPQAPSPDRGDPTLSARPSAATDPLPPGRHDLDLSWPRDGFVYVPEGLDTAQEAPLLVLLHGSGGDANNWSDAFFLADTLGVVLLAIDARFHTWDLVVLSAFGGDVAFIDGALEKTFSHVTADPARIALAGFSDGASYTLSLGPSNGDLFTHLIAWSPGFALLGDEVERAQVFVSHGSGDGILPVETTRDVIVPALQQAGYSVHYEEFDGGHEITSAIARQAFDWFLN